MTCYQTEALTIVLMCLNAHYRVKEGSRKELSKHIRKVVVAVAGDGMSRQPLVGLLYDLVKTK